MDTRSEALRARIFDALDRISALALGSQDLDAFLKSLLAVVMDASPVVDMVTVLLREGDYLKLRAAAGIGARLADLDFPIGQGFAGTIAATAQPRELRDASRDPEILGTVYRESNVHALYGVPMQEQSGRVIGVAHMGSLQVYAFSDADKVLFRAMVDRATAGVVQHQLREAAERAARELRRSDERFRIAIQGLPLTVFEQDESLRYRYIFNPGPGLTPEAVVGRTEHEVFPTPGEADRLVALKQSVLDTRVPRRETLALTFGDELRQLEVALEPILEPDGRVSGLYGAAFDVTERQRAESTQRFLAQAGQLLAGSLDFNETISRVVQFAVPDVADWCAFYALDEDGQPRLRAMAHRNRERLHYAVEAFTRFPADRAPFGIRAALRSGKSEVLPDVTDEMLQRFAQSEAQLQVLRRLGFASILTVPLKVRGRATGVLIFATSESGRRLTDAHIGTFDELARLTALALDNARLYAEAQSAIRAREEFLGTASHELKSPLTALRLQLQMLRRRLREDGSMEKIADGLQQAEAQSGRLARLVSDLLDVTRLSTGRLSLAREEVDLREVVHETVQNLTPEIAASGVQMDLRLDTPVRGEWDKARLEQVATNLISNGVKYGAGRPIHVTIGCAEGWASLEVRDEGVGIPREALNRLFEPFSRPVRVEGAAGTGLGLYITRQLVEQHGGRIEVQSEIGRGSAFTVLLPLHPPRKGDRPKD